jgi:proteasome lid subunit RPN8/RPN11
MPAELVQELVDHARAGAPNEACGILAGDRPAEDGGMPTRLVPLRNAAASPYRYLIDAEEQLAVMLQIEDAGEVIWGIFHSHVASPAEPSATDVGLAFYPDAVYLICSLAAEEPVIRGWTIRDGRPSEVTLLPG